MLEPGVVPETAQDFGLCSTRVLPATDAFYPDGGCLGCAICQRALVTPTIALSLPQSLLASIGALQKLLHALKRTRRLASGQHVGCRIAPCPPQYCRASPPGVLGSFEPSGGYSRASARSCRRPATRLSCGG